MMNDNPLPQDNDIMASVTVKKWMGWKSLMEQKQKKYFEIHKQHQN